MRLPNGYGSVTKLSGNRRRPWIVRKWDKKTSRHVPIGYGRTKKEALDILTAYNRDPYDLSSQDVTVQELYDLWLEKKAPRLGESNRSGLKSAFRYCESLANKPYRSIKAYHMQEVIDNCPRGYGVQRQVKNVWNHLDAFARELDIITSGYSDLLHITGTPAESTRTVFSEDEIDTLWKNTGTPWVDTVLFFIYTGFRITEVFNLTVDSVDMKEQTLRGGIKTASGRNRIVPIHHRILPFVEQWVSRSVSGNLIENTDGGILTSAQYRKGPWADTMKQFGMKHTPHEARHTFRSRLDSAGANGVCINLMMGHKSQDIGERVYTHKTLQELRDALELVT